MLSEYDLKQVRLMGKKIALFEIGKLTLFDLFCDLNGLLNVLESVAEAWKNDFQAANNNLEMIHDSIVDGSISKWQGNFKEDMHQSISKMKNMIAFLIGEYLKRPDPNILDNAIEALSNWLICPKCNDAWESTSSKLMVICPRCECVLRNPRASIANI